MCQVFVFLIKTIIFKFFIIIIIIVLNLISVINRNLHNMSEDGLSVCINI